jgi:hypothetical protein
MPYVDPYPDFYQALHDYALAGLRLVERLPLGGPNEVSSVPRYFAALEEATRVLGKMAVRELRGEPFSAEQMAFINDAVRVEKQDAVCTTIDVPNGWYANLFLDRQQAIVANLTIADVHTQPADAGGTLVGNVLHVGTGFPRLMVTSVDTCMGPRAYAGVVYAYHEDDRDELRALQRFDLDCALRRPKPDKAGGSAMDATGRGALNKSQRHRACAPRENGTG